jgi:uncharacterized protein YegL
MSTSDDDREARARVRAQLEQAASQGTIGAATQALLSGHLGEVVIAGAAGRELETLEASDVMLVTVLLDASSSIHARGLEKAVREGYNQLLEAFALSRERDALLMALWLFNDHARVVHSYVPVVDAAPLDARSYRTGGGTALYDTWCDALAANLAYAQQLRSGGTPCRSLVVVLTDGEDYGSRRRPGDCARVSRDLLASEQFVLAFVGVGDAVDYRRVAASMGVPDGCVLVQRDARPGALRQAFQLVSQSTIRLSQSQIAPGPNTGFFN